MANYVSIFRLLQLRSEFAILVRIALLSSMFVLFFACCCKASTFFSKRKDCEPYEPFIAAIIKINPLILLAHFVSLTMVVMVHNYIDRQCK